MMSGRASSAQFVARPVCPERSIRDTRLVTRLEDPLTRRGPAIISSKRMDSDGPASRRGQPQTRP